MYAKDVLWGSTQNLNSMIGIAKHMKYWKVSTLMFVDLSQRPPLPETNILSFVLMTSRESVGSSSHGRKMRHSPCSYNSRHWLRNKLKKGEGSQE